MSPRYPLGRHRQPRSLLAWHPPHERRAVECSIWHVPRAERSHIVFKALIVLVVIFFIATFPATWLLMLFLGNVGLNLSYWGTLPLGILVSVLLSAAITPSTVTTIIND